MEILPLRNTLGTKPEAQNIRKQYYSSFTAYAAFPLIALASLIHGSEPHFYLCVASIVTRFFPPVPHHSPPLSSLLPCLLFSLHSHVSPHPL